MEEEDTKWFSSYSAAKQNEGSDLALPFSEEELKTTVRVLSVLQKDKSVYHLKHKGLKELRKIIHKLGEYQLSRRYEGKSPEAYKAEKQRIQEILARKNRQKVQDRKLIENRKLRLSRRVHLNALLQQKGNDQSPLIPDGAVDDGFNTSIGQSGGMFSYANKRVSLYHTKGIENVPLVLLDKAGKAINHESDLEEVSRPQSCYICKCRFYRLHHFYATLCPTCAKENWEKRHQSANLKGKVALVTGGRVKIGYQIVLKLLRMGAKVIATTRFPADAYLRYKKETDFCEWSSRLQIYQLDFKSIALIEEFVHQLLSGEIGFCRLDIIINNACQTIRRPLAYYKHLLEMKETWARDSLEQADGIIVTSKDNQASRQNPIFHELSLDKSEKECFPQGWLDGNAQQIDLRKRNSWLLKLDQVETIELLEVLAINTVAPFVLNSKLKGLLIKSRDLDISSGEIDCGRYIINVSAMEGKFYRFKSPNHPHTNMAKASLNMMTRTSAADYAEAGIFMNSVDTGWINDENPLEQASRIARTNNFQTPIDEIDAASRVLDPIVVGMKDPEKRMYGLFLKDYEPTEW